MGILGNNFWEGVLGIVRLYFNTVDCGKTMEDTEINADADYVDVVYNDEGTKPADMVRTGLVYRVKVTFAEIDTSLLEAMLSGFEPSGQGNSVKLSRNLYQSMKTTEAKVLTLKRLEDDLAVTTDPHYMLNFYKAVPKVTTPIVYGASKQRNVGVEFTCFWDDAKAAFGYSGVESSMV